MLLPIQICLRNDSFNQILLDENEFINIEFKELYEKLGEAMFRSKARWIERGEKATNYFFNLEKRNYEKKVIAQLKLENGEIISDIKQINEEIESFHSNLLETNSSNQGRNMVYGLRAQSPKYDRDQGSEERAWGSEEWDQGSQGF